MATMRDVAERAGVSAKTVSRVVNRDRYVSADVRGRVEAAIEALQYRPNMLAVTFRNGRDAAIGIAVPGVADPFFASIVDAVELEASRRGVAVIVASVGWDGGHERRSLEAVLQRQVAGMIVVPVGDDLRYLRAWQRTPMVFADRAPARLAADVVVQDDVGGGALAARHLLGHGHRRIAFMGDGRGVPTAALRLQGFRQALSAAGATPAEELVHLGDIDTPALQALRRTDVAVVGFGDFPVAAALRPAVTVVDQDGAAMGRFAAERLFTRLEHPQRRLRRRTVLPVQLVTRTSCGLRGERLRAGHTVALDDATTEQGVGA